MSSYDNVFPEEIGEKSVREQAREASMRVGGITNGKGSMDDLKKIDSVLSRLIAALEDDGKYWGRFGAIALVKKRYPVLVELHRDCDARRFREDVYYRAYKAACCRYLSVPHLHKIFWFVWRAWCGWRCLASFPC